MHDLIGDKGLNLMTFSLTGYPVLSGFYVLPEAYRAFLQQSDLEQSIAAILAEKDLSDPEQLRTCGVRIRHVIMERDIPNNIKAAILPAYWRLFRLPANGKLYVEVTSSVRIEDQPQSSFTGQPEGFGSIFGETDLLCAIKKCWASLWSDQAIAYRHIHHIDHTKVSVTVLVQHKALLEIFERLLSTRSSSPYNDVEFKFTRVPNPGKIREKHSRIHNIQC
ncbi:phosphoenolpyruvate synthase/pyruvate phosphate dikinase [Candidatus Vecturithrix granuli]|uniref:Phosphoenolpyruvate synthase n=1 Tax=Vecturithrix granuli TaxID=1499967 RepID=A0A081C2A9_VECG1|nr:phosphoenolpyruvate synthase/pyruvate phosphate dikinase [Candidatus Vecturithrix granuli]